MDAWMPAAELIPFIQFKEGPCSAVEESRLLGFIPRTRANHRGDLFPSLGNQFTGV
jgi:hypothetical protein